MKNLAIVLATMCIFAHATTVFQTPAFLEIKKSPFGSSVASLVELNMSSGDPSGRLDAISEVLNTVEATLVERSSHNEGEIQRERGWCDDQESNLKSQINNALNDLAAQEEEQSNLNTEQSDLNTSLNNERQDLASNEENLDNANQALSDENDRYTAAAKDYSDAIAACEQGLQLLSTLKANPSGFIQSKARFGNVVALLQRHLSNKSSTFVQPILTVLSELSTTTQDLDQAKLGKVVSLIEQLLEELRNQSAQNEQRHVETVDNLTSTIANLETLISNSEDLITRYEARLSEIADRLQQLAGLISTSQALLDLLKGQLQSTQDTCAGYESDFASVKSEIDQQIATLEKLKDYFHSQVVPSVENVRDSSYEDSLSA